MCISFYHVNSLQRHLVCKISRSIVKINHCIIHCRFPKSYSFMLMNIINLFDLILKFTYFCFIWFDCYYLHLLLFLVFWLVRAWFYALIDLIYFSLRYLLLTFLPLRYHFFPLLAQLVIIFFESLNFFPKINSASLWIETTFITFSFLVLN